MRILFLGCILLISLSARAQTVQLVKDPGTSGPFAPHDFLEYNGKLYFIADSATAGNAKLWVTDGTSQGTHIFVNLFPGYSDHPDELTLFNNQLFFHASNGDHSAQLNAIWTTDGTPTGTHLVTSIQQGGDIDPYQFTPMNGRLYFVAQNEIWSTDGTKFGTHSVTSVPLRVSSPVSLGVFKNKLYFVPTDDRPWVTDGVQTQILFDILNSGDYHPFNFTACNGLLYFTTFTRNLWNDFWVSDGTDTGTRTLGISIGASSAPPTIPMQFQNKLCFQSGDSDFGSQLWTTDGTNAGSTQLTELNLPSGNYYYEMLVYNDRLFFTAADKGSNTLLWSTDGTPSGVRREQPLTDTLGRCSNLAVCNGKLFFTEVYGDKSYRQFWVSDGSPAATKPVPSPQDPRLGNHGLDSLHELYSYNNALYFNGGFDTTLGANIQTLWRIDATNSGVPTNPKQTQRAIIVYPNPATTTLKFQLQHAVNITITNAIGTILLDRKLNPAEKIDISTWQPGIYFVRNWTDGVIEKVVKE